VPGGCEAYGEIERHTLFSASNPRREEKKKNRRRGNAGGTSRKAAENDIPHMPPPPRPPLPSIISPERLTVLTEWVVCLVTASHCFCFGCTVFGAHYAAEADNESSSRSALPIADAQRKDDRCQIDEETPFETLDLTVSALPFVAVGDRFEGNRVDTRYSRRQTR